MQRAMQVGIDLTDVDEVADALSRFGDRYAQRIYTDRELADCEGDARARAEGLAARFAAKEATLKALAVPEHFGVDWRQVEVRRGPDRRPTLHLGSGLAALAAERGIQDWAVSLTHQGHLAAAVVIGT